MKTIPKILIAIVIGLAAGWLCNQVLHLEQTMSTFAALLVAQAVAAVFDKVNSKK